MSGQYKFNRQKNDYLLTDLLPSEKGNHYTHRYFYEYLQCKRQSLNSLYKEILKGKTFFDKNWHSIPLKFKISKKGDEFRDISLINPLGLIESLAFIQLFENDIINIIQNKNDFSARKARRTNNLTYKKNKNQTVYYTDDPYSKKQLLISLESSGTYHKHFPCKTITKLLNSKSFIYSLDRYNLLLKIDIQDCFPSIYTHSFKWLISNKIYDSKKLINSNSVYKNIDSFLQNLNGSKTNGIIVGPEISRLLAEFLFVHIDEIIIQTLEENNIIPKRDYTIYRFVDDYYIFTDSREIQDEIKVTITNIINEFQLKINEAKVKKFEKSDILNQWYLEVTPVINGIENIFSKEIDFIRNKTQSEQSFLDIRQQVELFDKSLLQVAATINPESSDYLYPLKKSQNKVKYLELRNRVNSIIKSTNEEALIPSYILSTILKKIESKDNDKLTINMKITELITFILFTFTKKVTYASCQKVIRIFSLLIEKEVEGVKAAIERNIERFQNDIFTKFTNDWIDLLLFFACYQINLSKNLMDTITKKIIIDENPLNLSSLCLLAESDYISSGSIVREVNSIIKSKVEMINWKSFFEDKESWWVYIFYSYPKLNKRIKKNITDELEYLNSNIKDTPSDAAKRIVIDFLLDTKEHFIEWNFTRENYYKNYYFYTKDRTVFNPDIIDQVDISR